MNSTDSRPLMVTIRCITYNHEPYIRQCLEGFVMQKTNFRFEAVVHDDASTDGTANIIREYAEKYPDIIKPIYETENQYSKHDGSLSRIMDEHTHGKYIAFCEGDDYWTDMYKLQKQYDFLETNPKFIMSHTAYMVHDVSKNEYHRNLEVEAINKNFNNNYNPIEIIATDLGAIIQTLTVVINAEVYFKAKSNDPFLFSGYFLMGDTQLWYQASKYGMIHYLHDITCVYRKVKGSATNSTNSSDGWRFMQSVVEMRKYISIRDNFPEPYKSKIDIAYNDVTMIYTSINKLYKPLYPVSLTHLPLKSKLTYVITHNRLLYKIAYLVKNAISRFDKS